MHEAGLMQSALEIAEQHAKQRGGTQIHRLGLRIGKQSGVVAEALEFAFQALAPGTMAVGAKLEIMEIPVVCQCEDCQREFEPDSPFYACPICGALSRNVLKGRELELVELEIS